MSQTIDNRVAKKYTGINWDKAKNKWMIVVKHDGKNKFLGYTNDQEEGNAIRIDYINKYIKPILDERKDDRTLFENNICDFYLKLNNLEKTGERFNISASTVLEILKKNKINIRSNEKKIKNLDEVLFWYDLGESASLISSKIGLSVTTIIRKLKSLHKNHY